MILEIKGDVVLSIDGVVNNPSVKIESGSKLAEAIDKYKSGDKAVCLTSARSIDTLNGKFSLSEDGNIWCGTTKWTKCLIYIKRKDEWAEKLPDDNINTDDMLDYANKNYPLGTNFRDRHGNKRTVSLDSHYIGNDGVSVYVGGTPENEWASAFLESNPKLYHEGKWAEIVKEYEHPNINDIRQEAGWWSDEEKAVGRATAELMDIAKYYNSKFPEDKIIRVIKYNIIQGRFEVCFNNGTDLIGGDIHFSLSSANAALENPHVLEVLKTYMKIK